MRKGESQNQVYTSEQLEAVYRLTGPEESTLFTLLQKLSKHYDEKTTIYLTKEFCLNCHSDENKRVGMEFLYMNGFQDDLTQLIEMNKQSHNQVNNEWAEVYEFILDRRKKSKFKGELLEFAKNFKTSDPTLACLLIFLQIYGHNEMFEYEKLGNFQDMLTQKLLEIDNTLMRIYFQLRENEVLFHFNWKKNELEIARKYAQNIIENTYNQEKKCEIYINLAVTYLFEDYNKALELLSKAKMISKEFKLFFHIKAIDNKILPFIASVNGCIEGIETTDEIEKAHLAVVKGDNEYAIKILKNVKVTSPFQEYYLGIALNNKGFLQNSYNRFLNERKDYFFAQLPLKELIKRGWMDNEKDNYIN